MWGAEKDSIRSLDNIVTFGSIKHFLESYNGEQVDVILTEVIEHMSLDEAKELIHQICAHVDFDKFIITTPNADFNRYYELSDFRHDDHKWEMGEESFQQWMRDVIMETNLHVEFAAVGDGVNNIQTTQGVILKKRGA